MVAGQCRRYIGLFTGSFEVTAQGLRPHHATPTKQWLMSQLQACISGVVIEPGTHFAAFDFLLLVVAVTNTQACQLEAGKRVAQLTAKVPALLLHIDIRHCTMFFIMVMAVGMLVGQQPVAIVLLRVGRAEITALANETGAQGEAVSVVVEAFLPVRRTGNLVLVGLTLGALGTHRKITAAGGNAKYTGAFIGDAVGTQLQLAFIAFLRYVGRHLAVNDIDHASNGSAAIQQGRRPFQHFDSFGQQRLADHRMIRADGRGVEQLHAVAQHLHPRPIEATNDRPRDTGTETAGVHARQALQRFPQRRLSAHHQLLPFHDGHRHRHLMALLAKTAGADDHGIKFDRISGPGSRNHSQADSPGKGVTFQFHVILQGNDNCLARQPCKAAENLSCYIVTFKYFKQEPLLPHAGVWKSSEQVA